MLTNEVTFDLIIKKNNMNAQKIAVLAHMGQKRRDGVTPYINHVADVVMRLVSRGITSQVIFDAAWLHDVIEDTHFTYDDLRRHGISEEVIETVSLLTRTSNIPNEQYLEGIKGNPFAKPIKIADMLSNLSDNPTEKQIYKYAKSLVYLME